MCCGGDCGIVRLIMPFKHVDRRFTLSASARVAEERLLRLNPEGMCMNSAAHFQTEIEKCIYHPNHYRCHRL
jgi:hypothetical protein